jgi:hypothetical protein
MRDGAVSEELADAGTEFRRRLAAKLAARGYGGAALRDRIEELLRTVVKRRLNIDEIMGASPPTDHMSPRRLERRLPC